MPAGEEREWWRIWLDAECHAARVAARNSPAVGWGAEIDWRDYLPFDFDDLPQPELSEDEELDRLDAMARRALT